MQKIKSQTRPYHGGKARCIFLIFLNFFTYFAYFLGGAYSAYFLTCFDMFVKRKVGVTYGRQGGSYWKSVYILCILSYSAYLTYYAYSTYLTYCIWHILHIWRIWHVVSFSAYFAYYVYSTHRIVQIDSYLLVLSINRILSFLRDGCPWWYVNSWAPSLGTKQ